MKKELTANTRWQYYAANMAGLLTLVLLLGWCSYQTLTAANGVTLRSFQLWIGLLSLIMLPFAIISFFSSMKTVIVTQKGITISYVFQKHQVTIVFSEIADFRSNRKGNEKVIGVAVLNDSFLITLTDGRMFSFSGSQFKQYSKLKTMVYQAVKKK